MGEAIKDWDTQRLRQFILSILPSSGPDKSPEAPSTALEKFGGTEAPVGTIWMWAGVSQNDVLQTIDPPGWFVCDGRQLLKAEYPALAKVCRLLWTDYSHTSTDSDKFRIPDFRDTVPIGQTLIAPGPGNVMDGDPPGKDQHHFLKFTDTSGFTDNFRTLAVTFIIKH